MTASDLFPTLRSLSRADKLRVMQFLVAELAREEKPTLQIGATYSVWSPLNSHEASHKLAQLLESENDALCVMLKDSTLQKDLMHSVFPMHYLNYLYPYS
jgi:hypothetical protein